jgi:hypothetical protein
MTLVILKRKSVSKDYKQITKAEFYNLGGFANSNIFRKADKLGRWRHYKYN